MEVIEIIETLRELGNETDRLGMARFGINAAKAFGIKMPVIQQFAKEIGKNHKLAQQVWDTGFHEARLLAVYLADPKKVTEAFMESWVKDFNSWDICDQACGVLFDKTPFAYAKALEWSARTAEFQKRAGFALMAWLAVHDKKAPDETFIPFLPVIAREASDERNFVKKAVNWALRQIGKRNLALNEHAKTVAENLKNAGNKSARWVGSDAFRELTDEKQLARLQQKSRNKQPKALRKIAL